jgi:hypothetical protein
MSDNPYKSPSKPSDPHHTIPASKERRAAASHSSSFYSIVFAEVSILITGALLGWVVCTQDKFNRIFADFNAKTSALSDVVRSAPFVWVVGLLLGLTAVKEFFLKNATAKITCSALAIFTALLLGILYAIGMFQPMIAMIDKLSK